MAQNEFASACSWFEEMEPGFTVSCATDSLLDTPLEEVLFDDDRLVWPWFTIHNNFTFTTMVGVNVIAVGCIVLCIRCFCPKALLTQVLLGIDLTTRFVRKPNDNQIIWSGLPAANAVDEVCLTPTRSASS